MMYRVYGDLWVIEADQINPIPSALLRKAARPDLAKEMGFIGGKMPLKYSPADGEEGLRKNIEQVKKCVTL
ncbi:hypothetical protein MUO14_23845 [Halobacillus shinanisalinarum]|uniref:Uncharacterized protein n=1 Tax=Halobacillus shinanisalinarum TaxID=2932258 RepID=A0ABY4H0D5_9BACI|nr:hypothetical protein [Halobacillus shinanisalinarum]UOQ93365.1 hypothetical protein MUO14_23845 [Halobacillus shinanisalinarum]